MQLVSFETELLDNVVLLIQLSASFAGVRCNGSLCAARLCIMGARLVLRAGLLH